jgi:hypothetical protein
MTVVSGARWVVRPPSGVTGESGTPSLPCGVVPAPLRRLVPVVVAASLTSVSLAGCSDRVDVPRDGLAPDTARVSYGARRVEVPLTACGREGDIVVLGGATGGGVVLQAEADVGDGGSDRTGVTVDLVDEGILGAFGADMALGPAGEISAVRVEGDRLIVEGTWVWLDEQLRPGVSPSDQPGEIDGKLVARCPEPVDEVAAPAGAQPSTTSRRTPDPAP